MHTAGELISEKKATWNEFQQIHKKKKDEEMLMSSEDPKEHNEKAIDTRETRRIFR